MPEKFSRSYSDFDAWYAAQQRRGKEKSAYVQRIVRAHETYPTLSLRQLRGHARKPQERLSYQEKVPLYERDPDTLTEHQKDIMRRVRDFIYRISRGEPIKFAEKGKEGRKDHISFKTVRKYSDAFEKKGNRWVLKPNDHVMRYKWIIEKDKGFVRILTNNRKQAEKVNEYHDTVMTYEDYTAHPEKYKEKPQDASIFKGKYVLDAQGKRHYLEYDQNIIHELLSVPESHYYIISSDQT